MVNSYCSAKFKTGEELDEALVAALTCCNDAERAEAAAKRAEAAAESVADRQSIVNDVLAALPTYNGEVEDA